MKRQAKIVKWFFKVVVAGIVAFLILNIATYFYYFVPYNITCESGSTDYKLPAGFCGYNMREGFGRTQIDANGYNNMSIPSEINVLCMGSSHSLGYNVFPEENYVAILNESLQSSLEMTAYNIGMYGHEWYYCMRNLESALEEFRPSQYVVIESFYSKFDTDKLEKLNHDEYGKAGEVVSPVMGMLKKVPYFQIAMSQMKNMMSDNKSTKEVVEKVQTEDKKEYIKQLTSTMQKAKEVAERYGVQLVFLYHPNVMVGKDGTAYTDTNDEYFEIWQRLCEENEIFMVSMEESFLSAYKQDYILPRGFENTEMGEGHLNRYGHQMIAEKLYQRIMTEEMGGEK